jgi:hypothetical protein
VGDRVVDARQHRDRVFTVGLRRVGRGVYARHRVIDLHSRTVRTCGATRPPRTRSVVRSTARTVRFERRVRETVGLADAGLLAVEIGAEQ